MTKWIIVGTQECPVQGILKIIKKSKDFHHFHEKWTSFADDLGIGKTDTKKLQKDLNLDKAQLSDVVGDLVRIWVGQESSQATLDKLIEALESNGLNVSADSLRNEYQLQSCHLLESPNHYVSRTLISRSRLNKRNFLKEISKSKDIFTFTGIPLSTLSNLLEKEIVEYSTKLIDLKDEEITHRHVILDHSSHYKLICELARHPVHLIRVDVIGNTQTWTHIKSNGNWAMIERSADSDNQPSVTENELLHQLTLSEPDNHPICISDSPGMGKTTLLQNFGQKLIQSLSNRLVWFISVNQFVKTFRKYKTNVNSTTAFQLTCYELFCKNSYQKSHLSLIINSTNLEIELLLDGLDEVVSSNAAFSFEVLKTLATLPFLRLWVTTRPHLLQHLERCLNVFGYNIQPFNTEDQINFLVRFWKSGDRLNEKSLLNSRKTVYQN